MSERLTDDELTIIEQRADELDASGVRTAHPWMRRAVTELRELRSQARHWQRETERVKHELATCRDAHAALIGNYSDVMDEKNKLVVEVKERRANVLSDEDRLALEDARDFISDDWSVNYGGSKLQALVALDRLLSRGKDGR